MFTYIKSKENTAIDQHPYQDPPKSKGIEGKGPSVKHLIENI
jgi:hypothetical protein